jgi:hypothetical protein
VTSDGGGADFLDLMGSPEDSERPKGAKLSEERSDENTERPLGAKVTRDQRIMRAKHQGGVSSFFKTLPCFFVQGFHQCPGIPWRCVEFA